MIEDEIHTLYLAYQAAQTAADEAQELEDLTRERWITAVRAAAGPTTWRVMHRYRDLTTEEATIVATGIEEALDKMRAMRGDYPTAIGVTLEEIR